ncbi:helix-turn-helix domain-containing protein [Streptomyces sp. KLOTTS4A1]|uniref:helix-turn-helix domain-containing protein n=1 Tax=Streptomyces sp. KLOTTS4A1 TaxID=3390996 RepID=UPI0039F52F48
MVQNSLTRLRLLRGYTQEELSELSGISVRTIRNLERGQVHKPRRSSVEMLLTVLDPEWRREGSDGTGGRPAGPDSAGGLAWAELLGQNRPVWRGPRPVRSSLIGRGPDVRRLEALVGEQQIVAVTGAAGIGKTRLAQAAAELCGPAFPDGVAVVELGRIPGEDRLDPDESLELAALALEEAFGDRRPAAGRQALVLLDNAEHLPTTTARLVERLVTQNPRTHLLVTSRQVPELTGATVWEVPSLTPEAAVDLLLDRLGSVCPRLDLSGARQLLDVLCGELDRLPRLVEFAAHRLRGVPLETLVSDSRVLATLGSADRSLLPHQRSLAASVQWSLGLLEEGHRSLLSRLASSGEHASAEILWDVPADARDVHAVDGLARLVDTSLVQVDRGGVYRYRVLRHVRTVLTASGVAAGERVALSA